jgi:hypothetical protein
MPVMCHPLLATVLLAACATPAPRQDDLARKAGVSVSSEALSARMQALLPPMTARIEMAADQIRNESSDPAVQRQAILWKVNTIPALYGVPFSQQPAGDLRTPGPC